MFIQTEATADPTVMKFLPDQEVVTGRPVELKTREEAAISPLADAIFSVPGVTQVALGRDYVMVTLKDGDWAHLKPMVLGAIMEHFVSGAPVLRPEAEEGGTGFTGPTGSGDGRMLDEINEAIRQVIDPELGYNILDLGLIYDVTIGGDGMTTVTMTTTTKGCPATNYLKSGAGEAALSVDGVTNVDVQLTYEPPWTPDMMSPEAKAYFGIRDGGRW